MESKYEDEYKDFLQDLLTKPSIDPTPPPLMPTSEPKKIPSSEFVPKVEKKTTIPKPNIIRNRMEGMMYEDVILDTLPTGIFYFPGTRIQFRDLKVKEIEHFSTLDESNVYNFKEKLNDILENAILFDHADGTVGSYLDIKETDRVWLIYLIREKTFPKGKVLSVNVNYKEGTELKSTDIELVRKNIEKYSIEEDIMKYFNNDLKCFVFETSLREQPFHISPPSIGLKKCFDQFLKIKAENKEKINYAFFKIAPFLYPHLTYMDYDELKEIEKWFEDGITADEFAFLTDLIDNHLKIGIRGLKKNVGENIIRTTKMYPKRLSTLFVLPDAFGVFLKK